MTNKLSSVAHPAFPRAPSAAIDDPTPADQAVYVPSVTPGFAKHVFKNQWTRDLPNGVKGSDLNPLAPNSLFQISHAMSSAGQAANQKQDCIITTRDRKRTRLICDSGGYQIATKQLEIRTDADRLKILRWIETHGDFGMTLDVPTGPVLTDPDYSYKTTQDCLRATLDHLEFFRKHRKPGRVKLLNVLQGNTLIETDAWYDAVKGFEFEGWAFAGKFRHNMYALCRRIIMMIDQGQIHDKTWIHVLGTSELDVAVMLTALQRAINEHVNPNLRISFDTSSAFRHLSFNLMYTTQTISSRRMTMQTSRPPDGAQFIKSDLPWVWSSPLGDRMVLGDFCVPKPKKSTRYRDSQSYHYLAHHNLATLCSGIALANRLFDCDIISRKYTFASSVGRAAEAIGTVIKAGDMSTLEKFRGEFAGVRHSPKYIDEERDVFKQDEDFFGK